MNEVVREWITKAEGDFATATREMASPENPNFDAVCFHAQQWSFGIRASLQGVKRRPSPWISASGCGSACGNSHAAIREEATPYRSSTTQPPGSARRRPS